MDTPKITTQMKVIIVVANTLYRDLLTTIKFGGIVKFYNWRD